MSTQTNKEAVEFFFSNLNNGNFAAAFEKVADDVAWWIPGTLPFSGTKDKKGYMAIVERIRGGFPGGLVFEIKSLVGEDEKVAAEVESMGRHANGKTYANKYHFLFAFKDGRVIGVKEYMDTLHLKDLIS